MALLLKPQLPPALLCRQQSRLGRRCVPALAFPWLANVDHPRPALLISLVAFALICPWLLLAIPGGCDHRPRRSRRLMVQADVIDLALTARIVASPLPPRKTRLARRRRPFPLSPAIAKHWRFLLGTARCCATTPPKPVAALPWWISRSLKAAQMVSSGASRTIMGQVHRTAARRPA